MLNRISPSGAAATAAALILLALPPAAHAQVEEPTPVSVTQDGAQAADGFIFIAPIGSLVDSVLPRANSVQGPEIVDSQGRAVWFLPTHANQLASDFRVQSYKGSPVLTWVQGPVFEDTQPGATTDFICDNTYTVVATVHAGNGLNADEHEFQLTPQGTALITAYALVPADLSSVGGPVNGNVLEGCAQEVDVATGAVLLDWRSMDHVALAESYNSASSNPAIPFDFFHINSVKLDTDGNILISARYTKTVYKIDRATGAVIWRLGGKKSDFALGAGLPFAWQHDAEAVDASTIRIFDNESDGAVAGASSRIIWVTHDDAAMTTSVARTIEHPADLLAPAEGNAQSLANGDIFVDWGVLGRYSEFDAGGNLVYDASLYSGYSSYRGYRTAWVGAPATSPSAVAKFNGDGTTTVHAYWNGATQVATWSVLGGDSQGGLSAVASAPWNGLHTEIVVPGQLVYYQVVGLDATGAAIGTSAAVAAPPTFSAQPASQVVASGGTVVFSVASNGPAATYQWMLNGSPLSDGASGATTVSGSAGPTLVIGGATQGYAGSYTCVATNAGASATTAAATLSLSATTDVGRLVNVSSRAQVGTGFNVLIMGFVVGAPTGAGSDTVLLRASGPALAAFGVGGILPDPELVLSGSGAAQTYAAGWGGSQAVSAASAAVGAFPWSDSSSLDQAAVRALAPGAYTAEVAGIAGDSGVALAEVYDATAPGTYNPSLPRLTNVSARALVGSGGDILIVGFVVGGSTSKTVLIRASGPALAAFGVAGFLPDPVLTLYGSAAGGAPLALNSGWGGSGAIASAASSVGAFRWPNASSADSALVVTLAPGAYTAQVAGASADSGVALVEVYEIP